MTKAKTYKSDVFAAIHETAAGMFAAGVIDKETMRSFEEKAVNDETIEAMKATRRGELVKVGSADSLLVSLNEED